MGTQLPKHSTEVSPIVQDVTISVYGSSCNFLFFCLILSFFLLLIYFFASHLALGSPLNRKRSLRSHNEPCPTQKW